ncbi:MULTISPECIES: fimbrial protein [Rahnella]|uniref:Fimbrial protein n=1 Tax=Rahnella laticis TaxID=2787622 RepID=A0ABS0E3B4_9GAMM|nr:MULTISPECIES: fimbrial protein [Rahnella]MBF7979189.1 fimbrial protein [Rahnella laticis]MBF7999546.1 fimbrial protein [Rahnella sp. LAC-M12]
MSITIRDDTCTIESGASTTLDFGKVDMTGFRTEGGEYKRATIKLTCPDTTTRVTATLTGTPDANTRLFKNAGTATVSARAYKAGTVTQLSNGTSWGLNVLNKAVTFEVDVQLLPSKESAQMQAGSIQIPLSITFSYS